MKYNAACSVIGAALILTLCSSCTDDSSTSDMQGAIDGAVDGTVDGAVDTTVDASEDIGPDLGLLADDAGRDAEPPFMGDIRSQPVTEAGPYRVGFRVLSTTYENPLDGSERTLRTVVWYPTEQRSTRGALYMREVFFRPEVEEDAPPIDGDRFPVMLFSHGSVAIAEQSYFFTEFMASHGWMVIAPDHEGNTIFDVESPPETYFLRPLDLKAALDHFEDLPADDPLAGRMGETTVVSGHSFGGYSTLTLAGAQFSVPWIREACASGERPASECAVVLEPHILTLFSDGFLDPRIDLAIPITPPSVGAYLNGGLAAIDVPVLLMTAHRDRTLPNATNGDLIAEDLDGETDLHLNFRQAGHFTFSNLCELLPDVSVGDGCGDGFADPVTFQRAVNAYALAFIRNRLWGDESAQAILTGQDDLGVRLDSNAW